MYTTYYLGAGASAKSIPCVADLQSEISKIFDYILDQNPEDLKRVEILNTYPNNQDLNITGYNVLNNWHRLYGIKETFIKDLSTQISIDTLAKIYFINRNYPKYNVLKAVLIASFMYWQKYNEIDNRYSNFWATLINIHSMLKNKDISKDIYFPKNINVVSWNYDNQLENSLIDILKINEGFKDICNEVLSGKLENVTGIKYIKMNGTAHIIQVQTKHDPNFKFIDEYDEKYIKFHLASIILFPDKYQFYLSKLKFCWESDDEDLIEGNVDYLAESPVKKTSTLVVVGYSFPSINHSRDKYVISNMTGLKKVYFQGKDKRDSERIMDSFKAIHENWQNLDLFPIESTGFFIPPEVTISTEDDKILIW